MKVFSRLISILLLTLSVSSVSWAQQSDKILFNGKIVTANPAQPVAEAVAISGDKIVAVGALAVVKPKVSSNAEMIDLKGKFLLPGLIDSHNHAISGGEGLSEASVDDVLLTPKELAAFATKTLSTRKGMRGDVLIIDGMHSGAWAASKQLDSLFNNGIYKSQPVVLRGSDGHTSWANQVMLARANIDAEFIKSLSDVDRKYFGHDDRDQPNGLISEDGFQYIRKALPPTKTNLEDSGIQGVKYLNSLGITAWLDPSAGSTSEGEKNGELLTYKSISDHGKLTAHVAAVVVADGNADPQPQIDVVKRLQNNFKNVKDVTVIGFKIFADGVMEYPTQTAALSIPYINSGQYGSLMVEPARFDQFVVAADKAKLLVHVHAIGDRATTVALNSFSLARRQNATTVPHTITHLQVVHPNDLKRFAELNVLASMQLLWATADIYTVDLVKPYIDPLLYSNHYPAVSLLKNGAIICGASDWNVSSANPFEAMYVAETRTGKFGVLDASQIMQRKDMLNAYTINAAKALMLESKIGSIEPGKQADFVLVDRDVLTVTPEQVKHTQVVWTMFGGKTVFSK